MYFCIILIELVARILLYQFFFWFEIKIKILLRQLYERRSKTLEDKKIRSALEFFIWCGRIIRLSAFYVFFLYAKTWGRGEKYFFEIASQKQLQDITVYMMSSWLVKNCLVTPGKLKTFLKFCAFVSQTCLAQQRFSTFSSKVYLLSPRKLRWRQ